MNTKQKIVSLQGKEAQTEKQVKIISGIITFILAFGFGFVAYFAKTLFLYLNSHHI